MRTRLLGVLVVVAACRTGPRAPAPVGNQTAAAADPAIELPPDPRVTEILQAARAERGDGDRAACVERLRTIDGGWLGSRSQGAEALALMKDCSGRADPYCDYYAEGMNEEGDPYCVLSLAVELGPRVAYADASAAPCRFTTDAPAVAIPGDAEHCVAIEAGTGIALDDLPEDGQPPPGVCASVVLYTPRGHAPLAIGGASFLEDVSSCCNADAILTRRRGAAVEVMVVSSGPSRDCFGGTASVDHFEVFRLTGRTLEPVEELSVGMH